MKDQGCHGVVVRSLDGCGVPLAVRDCNGLEVSVTLLHDHKSSERPSVTVRRATRARQYKLCRAFEMHVKMVPHRNMTVLSRFPSRRPTQEVQRTRYASATRCTGSADYDQPLFSLTAFLRGNVHPPVCIRLVLPRNALR